MQKGENPLFDLAPFLSAREVVRRHALTLDSFGWIPKELYISLDVTKAVDGQGIPPVLAAIQACDRVIKITTNEILFAMVDGVYGWQRGGYWRKYDGKSAD